MFNSLIHPFSATSHAASAATAASSAGTSSTASTNPGADLTNTFLQLLTIQLKNQSPLDPVDPNQFVTQLAQFNSLGELTQIQQLMQTLVNDVGGGAPAPAAAGNNLTSTPTFNSISH